MIIKKFLAAAVLATGFAGLVGTAYATVTPTQAISGSMSINGNSSSTKTSITFSNPANVGTDSGSFEAVFGATNPTTQFVCTSCVQMTSFNTGTATPFNLFTVTVGSDTSTLSVTSFTFSSNLTITGSGMVSLTGYKSTEAYFKLTTQSGVGSTTFSVVTAAPEPGALALFGAGLLGCALFIGRRRRGAKTAV